MDSGSGATGPPEMRSSSSGLFMTCIAKMGNAFNKAVWSFSTFTEDHLTGIFTFWVVKMILILVEPILVALNRTRINIAFQYAIATLSSVLFIIQILGESVRRFDEIEAYFIESQYVTSLTDDDNEDDDNIVNNVIASTAPSPTRSYFIHCVVFFVSRPEYLLEAVCLMLALVFIFDVPHLATLRLFRVFCLLW